MQKYIISIVLLLTFISPTMRAEKKELPTHKIKEVVITGNNYETERNLLPYTVSIIKKSQIEATGKNQLLSAISGIVPGLFVTERNIFGFGVSNGGAGGIKIRGIGGSPTNAVLMMIDGQPQFAGIYSHHIADFYKTEYVDRIEILRGPGSVLYGSNAMGGVINIITKNRVQNGMSTVAQTQYGSYDTWNSSITNMARYGKFSSLISFAYDKTDGTVRKFDFKQKSLYAKFGCDFNNNWKAGIAYSLTNSIGNDPIYPKLSNPESTNIYHQNIIRGEASMYVNNQYATTNGNMRIYYSYGNHYIDDPKHFHSLDDRFGILIYQNIYLQKGCKATAGLDFDTYTGKIPVSGGNAHTAGSVSTINRKSVTEYSPYVTFTQELFKETITLNAGIRMANSDRFETQWIPQFGITIKPNESWIFKTSVAKGYRNPSFKELYLYRTANTELEPEKMTNYEAGIEKQFSPTLSANLTAYYSKGDNLIQTKEMKNVNTGKFINKGIEAVFTAQPLNTLSIQASYSYLHTSLKDLTSAPKNQYNIAIAWQIVPQLSIDFLLKGVGSLYVGKDIEREDYVLAGAKISYDIINNIKQKKQHINKLTLFAIFDNITDCNYTINKGYKMPGFTANGGVKIHF